MENRDILAIGTSAGGVEALLRLAAAFPPDLPAAVLVTLHLSNQFKSTLDELLTHAGPLRAKFAVDGEPLRRGRIYLAPPDRHLLVENDRVVLGAGPRENNSRPAIDSMLRSIALCCCHRAVAVVLTGTLGDGASGLWAVQQCSGVTVVQDPRGAAFPQMPQSALEMVRPDYVVDLERLPALLLGLVQGPAGKPAAAPPSTRFEVEIAKGERRAGMSELDATGRRSVLACPDCNGVLWEIEEGDLARFRCHVGHTYTGDLLHLALDEGLRRALASAQRALEERMALTGRLRSQAERSGHRHSMNTWAARMRDYEQELKVVRDAIAQIEEIAARSELKRAPTGST